ncbi:flavoprotein [Nonomuraea turcica]|uniref:flavoprotein n=1 Tax=Nonomuraea sp. G32 TaxID=3067274 RepID=UPI0035302398
MSVLHVVTSAAPSHAGSIADLVVKAKASRWRVLVVSTPLGLRFFDPLQLEELTGEPVRSDFALGLLCELTGYGVPIVAVPMLKPALATHLAFERSLDVLRQMGVRVLFDPSAPYERRMPAWDDVLSELNQLIGGTSPV